MYGDEERGISASELFREEDARSLLMDAEFVHRESMKLFREFKKAIAKRKMFNLVA